MAKRKVRKKEKKNCEEGTPSQNLPLEQEARYRQGVAALKAQEWAKAFPFFEEVLRCNSQHQRSLENLGATYYMLRELPKAETALRAAIEIDNTHYRAHYNLGMVLKAKGLSNEALSAFKMALKLNPGHASASQMAAALGGAPDHQPKQAFVESLFDQYAPDYDGAMTNDLRCRVPERLHKLLQETITPNAFFEQVLDLGCGTGLSGLPFRRHAKELVGVDLSQKMLEVAKQKSIYDQLYKQNITQFLSETTRQFSLVILADVIVYLSQLDTLFQCLHRVLVDGGIVMLSIEETTVDPYELRESGRYAHSQTYIERLCREYGYRLSGKTIGTKRFDGGKPVSGCFYLIGKIGVSERSVSVSGALVK